MSTRELMIRLIMLILALVMSMAAWIYLFILNWKIGLAVMFILWADNIHKKYRLEC